MELTIWRHISHTTRRTSRSLPEGRTDLAAYKKDWTEYIGAGNRLEAAQTSDMHIQVGPGGDSAIASYVLHVRTHLKDGKVTNEDFQESDVFFKRSGAWKVVHLHYSPAPKKGK
jgi:ketosteroid isomerase-like protein